MAALSDLDELDAALARLHPTNPDAVRDPAQVAAIAARQRYDRLPLLVRLVTRKPAGYRARPTREGH